MSVRIGINPITWSNDDLPELGGATPLETCLAEAREAGYAGIELGNKFPRRAAALRPILDRHGLALVQAMGCEILIFAETTGSIAGARTTKLSRRPRLADGDWAGFGADLTALAEHVAKRGLALAYHHHMGTVVESAAEIDRLMDATGPAVGLLLDTGHLAYAGADPLAVAERHRGRINHVHCKDVRPAVLDRVRRDDASFLDAVVEGVFTVPGDGAIDYAPLLALLAGAGYRGWLVVEAEQDPEKAHPLTYARKGFDYLSRTARGAGCAIA